MSPPCSNTQQLEDNSGGGGGGTGVGALGLGILGARTLGALLARRPDGRLLGGRGGPAHWAPPRHLQQAGHAPSRGHVVLGSFASRLRMPRRPQSTPLATFANCALPR